MKRIIKEFFKSWAFVMSSLAVIGYLISLTFLEKFVLINKDNNQFFFYMFLEFLPLIIAIFAILISFTDKSFLKFLKDTKNETGDDNIYNEIILFFIRNTILVFVSLILSIMLEIFRILENPISQSILIFVFVYTLISLIQLVRFIFYFAKKKADFVNS